MEEKVMNDISENYCYQFICEGTLQWPSPIDDTSMQDEK